MNKNTFSNHSSPLLALLLFLVFAICILAVILASTGIYERLSERSNAAQDRRTTAMFIAAKLRQSDAQGGLRLETVGDSDALVLTEDIGGTDFCTWIYCHEGWLYEIFTPAGNIPKPGDGELLIPARGLELELDGALVHIELTDSQGRSISQSLMLRSGEEAP